MPAGGSVRAAPIRTSLHALATTPGETCGLVFDLDEDAGELRDALGAEARCRLPVVALLVEPGDGELEEDAVLALVLPDRGLDRSATDLVRGSLCLVAFELD